MSDPTAQSRGSPFAIVAVAAGLMLLVLLAAFLVVRRAEAIDGHAALASAFGTTDLPEGYDIERATPRLANGSRLVVLRDPKKPYEPPPDPSPKSADEGSAPAPAADGASAPAAPPKVDWTKVPLGEKGARPQIVTVLLLEPDGARSAIESIFAREGFGETASLPPNGGRVLADEGKLAWRGYDARWTLVRNYEPGPAFRDVMRVDASLPDQPAVVTAIWSRGERASREALESMLNALAPR